MLTHIVPLNTQFLVWQLKYLSLRWCFHFFTVWHGQPHLNVTAKSQIFTLLWNEDLKYEGNVTSTSCRDSNNTAPGNILFHSVKLNKIWKNRVNTYQLAVCSNLKTQWDTQSFNKLSQSVFEQDTEDSSTLKYVFCVSSTIQGDCTKCAVSSCWEAAAGLLQFTEGFYNNYTI